MSEQIVHTWADISPNVTLCGEPIRPGVLSTANQHAVTCPDCLANGNGKAH